MICPSCSFAIEPSYYFCPNCGKQVRNKALSISLWQQLKLYFICFFFAPFGFWPAYRYLLQERISAKVVGFMGTVFLIASCSIFIYEILFLWTIFNVVLPLLESFSQL